MKILACLFLLSTTVALLVIEHPAPETVVVLVRETTVADLKFEASLTKIRTKIPYFDERVVSCDKAVIEKTLPATTETFTTAGFTSEDAAEASLAGWENVRLQSRLKPTKCMDQASFQKYVDSLGRMFFRSSPSGATIELDSKPLHQKTDSKRWFEPNEYKVKYSKPDCCLPVEGKCTITEKAETDCFMELPRKP